MLHSRRNKTKNPGNKSTGLYIVIGVLLALIINFGLGAMLSSSTPIVAVKSNSMKPVFSEGDILIIQGVKAPDIKNGDIIVFLPSNGGEPIVHRVLTKNGDGTFQTKGDANLGQLPVEMNIAYNQILGKEILIIPLLGWVKIFIERVGVLNWVIIIAVVLIVVFIYTLTQKQKTRHSFKKVKKQQNHLQPRLRKAKKRGK